MPDRFEFKKRYYYPHMMPKDVAIWERFIETHPEFFDYCEYDVAVGSGPEFSTVVDDETEANVMRLYQRKIDVVGWKKGVPFIVECKPRASTSALGQLAGYVMLYTRDYNPATPPKAILLTDERTPDIEMIARQMGIEIIFV